MSIVDELRIHEAAVRAAATAVDQARAAHDPIAEAAAVAQLTAADAARQQFYKKLRRSVNGELEDYDPARAPGREFWEGKPR
ncbi:MAG TPA: hypothetical protein VFK05_12495 [Polyangiaceae bacterium]|nr:hypothetical protein [Polyangiaceae bacterium]